MTTHLAGETSLRHESRGQAAGKAAGTDASRQATGGDVLRQVLIVAATISTLVVNYLANALPLNGLSTGDISDRFDVFSYLRAMCFPFGGSSIWG